MAVMLHIYLESFVLKLELQQFTGKAIGECGQTYFDVWKSDMNVIIGR